MSKSAKQIIRELPFMTTKLVREKSCPAAIKEAWSAIVAKRGKKAVSPSKKKVPISLSMLSAMLSRELAIIPPMRRTQPPRAERAVLEAAMERISMRLYRVAKEKQAMAPVPRRPKDHAWVLNPKMRVKPPAP